jgi:HSP20 family protein
MASGRQDSPRGGQGNARADGGGLGGLFKGLGDFLNLVERLAEQGEHHVSQEREFTSPGGARGVYGFSVRLGVGGTPAVEHFGNVRATSEGPVVSETREPLVDIFDEGGEVVVVAEVPGVQEKDIHTELTGDVLVLSAAGPKRKYHKEILLPAAVDQAAHQQQFQNGYLELRFNKSKAEG